MNQKVVITGGAGYIGSTVAYALKDHGWTPIILDNLSTGVRSRVADFSFYEGDIADAKLWSSIVHEQSPAAIIHCAAKISVPESTEQPLVYYHENVAKTVAMLAILRSLKVTNVIFSSSASVYQANQGTMVTETDPVAPGSPYSRTKLMMEQVLADASKAYDFKVLCLRYFNPIGADPQLRTGQDQLNGHHVLAKLLQAHTFGHPFYVTGCEWPTRDGSGIRDYIHVWDLAMAHVKAVDSLVRMRGENVFEIVNLGSRSGTTVLELVEAFQKVTGTQLRLEKKPARPGDVAGAFASCDRAKDVLGWSSTLSLEDSIGSALEWSKVEKQRLKK